MKYTKTIRLEQNAKKRAAAENGRSSPFPAILYYNSKISFFPCFQKTRLFLCYQIIHVFLRYQFIFQYYVGFDLFALQIIICGV